MRQRVFPTPGLDSSHPVRNLIVAGLATTAMASSLLFASWGATHAQDGTSGAPPLEETNCVLVPASDIEDLRDAPDTEPGTSAVASPIVMRTLATPAATPATDLTGATPVASPVADATAEATPATSAERSFNEDVLRLDLAAATTSLASCLSEGKYSDVVDHTSPTFRGQLVGNGRPLPGDTYVSLAQTFPQIEYTILEIANPTLVNDTTATADIVWSLANQVRVDQWTFTRSEVQGLTMWTVESASPGTLTPSIESTTITTIISDNRYGLLPETVADDTLLFEVINRDAVDHELLVLKLEDGVSTDVLLRTPGPELPEGVTMVGQATIAQESNGRLLLTGLEPGTYTIVCLLPDENGVPHLADGMETTFTIEAP